MLRSWVATFFGRSGADAGRSRKVSSDLPVRGAHLQRLVPLDDPMTSFLEHAGSSGEWNFFLRLSNG